VSYDRHKDAYESRVKNFPESYSIKDSPLIYTKDPDGLKKFRVRRLNLKLILVGGLFTYWLCQWKCRQVEKFDRLKRKE
jgi:hypothetical protein